MRQLVLWQSGDVDSQIQIVVERVGAFQGGRARIDHDPEGEAFGPAQMDRLARPRRVAFDEIEPGGQRLPVDHRVVFVDQRLSGWW